MLALLQAVPLESLTLWRFLHWLATSCSYDETDAELAGECAAILDHLASGEAVLPDAVEAARDSAFWACGGPFHTDAGRAACSFLFDAMRVIIHTAAGDKKSAEICTGHAIDSGLDSAFAGKPKGIGYICMVRMIRGAMDESIRPDRSIPTIKTEAELLDLLRADPTKRGVSYFQDQHTCAAEFDAEARRMVRVLAWIEGGGTAYALLDASYNADCQADADTWARLPLRYGPFCSMWVLPDHPKATTKAGGCE